jgi:hypothetical protein
MCTGPLETTFYFEARLHIPFNLVSTMEVATTQPVLPEVQLITVEALQSWSDSCWYHMGDTTSI